MIVNTILCDNNNERMLISPFKNGGLATSLKKREKDMLKLLVIIYQLSTSGKYHIGSGSAGRFS